MCLIIDRKKTEEFSKKYKKNIVLTLFKSFWYDRTNKILKTLYRYVPITETLQFISEPIENVDVHNGFEIDRIEVGCIHCFFEKQTSNIIYQIILNDRYLKNHSYISLPIIVQSDDVISIGKFNKIDSLVVSKYKIPESSWKLLKF